MNRLLSFGAGVGLAFGWLSASLAQTPPAASAQTGVDARIAQLHSQLHITAAEEQNWQAVAAVMRQNAQAHAAGMAERQKSFATMNAVQDMQSFAQMTREQADQIDRLVGPFQTLYAQFSPDQKATADQIFHNHAAARVERQHG